MTKNLIDLVEKYQKKLERLISFIVYWDYEYNIENPSKPGVKIVEAFACNYTLNDEIAFQSKTIKLTEEEMSAFREFPVEAFKILSTYEVSKNMYRLICPFYPHDIKKAEKALHYMNTLFIEY